MTWNVWWRFGPRWRDRQPGIEATLRRFSPDVVAPQDDGREDFRGIELGIAVLNRWPILDHEIVPLPARHRSWDPVILAVGGLNAAPDSPVLRPLNELMTDAWVAGHGPPDAVTLPSSHPSAPLEAGPELVDQRIDHVFFRPGREDQRVIIEQVRLAGDAVDGVFPSDHRAVVTDLRWRGQRAP